MLFHYLICFAGLLLFKHFQDNHLHEVMNHFYKYHFETTVLNEDSENNNEELACFRKDCKERSSLIQISGSHLDTRFKQSVCKTS